MAMDPDSANAKGDELRLAAEKKMNEWSLFNKNQKREEAAEILEKAAAQYKIGKQFDKAGDCYVRAAELCDQNKSEHEATNHYMNAAKSYKLGNVKDALKLLEIVVQRQSESNKFNQAAKTYQEMAEIFEKDMQLSKAVETYQHAADAFVAADAVASANQMYLKVAYFAALNEEYQKAIEIYEKVSSASLDNNLLRWSCLEYLFHASLCHLAGGAKKNEVVPTRNALEKYKGLLPSFESSRECKLVDALTHAFEEADIDKFTDLVAEFDMVHKLDSWKATVLLQIKNQMKKKSDASEVNLK